MTGCWICTIVDQVFRVEQKVSNSQKNGDEQSPRLIVHLDLANEHLVNVQRVAADVFYFLFREITSIEQNVA